MKIQVRKCPFTGELFEKEDKYALHLANLRNNMRFQRKSNKVKDEWKNWLVEEKSKIDSIDNIVPWFIENQKKIMTAVNDIHGRKEFYTETDSFFDVVLNVRYNPAVSNSHVCPDNGIRNFLRTPEQPLSYIGWTGYISGTLVRDKLHKSMYPYGLALNTVGLKTGSGGGGNNNWRYGVSIFLNDWPGLAPLVYDVVINKLAGK